jgi:peptidyl-prolyl cis-trans isomerase A (cyclophilin A)
MAAFSSDTNRSGGFVDASRVTLVAQVCRWAVALLLCLFLGSLPGTARGGTLVNFNTQLGTIQVDLFDDLVPTTVNNFLSYVNSGAYANTLVHRSTSVADTQLAVIQGGGYTASTGTPLAFNAIPKSDPIVLQYNRANSRGTIAMARTLVQNSATSEWFINTSDNSTVLGQQNGGGFAVFGWVVGSGMAIADSINTLPKQTVAGFEKVPLKNFAGGTPTASNLVVTNSITFGGTHPSFQNPVMATDVVNDGRLRLTDAHALINDLLANGSHNVAGTFSGTKYLDVNGSNTVTLADAIIVINALLAQNPPGAPAMAEPMASPLAAPMMMPMNVVPEPATISLGAVAVLTLAAYAFARRRRRTAGSAR